jgi:DNA-binding PadR family transcriptional regulator
VSRIFRRGELKEAIVVVLSTLGEAHGYAIMAELKERVGGGWKPSPGAIYPALLALVESGHVRTGDHDGTRVYSLTESGERAAEAQRSSSRWASLSERAATSEERTSVGAILDRFAAGSGLRRRLTGPDQRERIDTILAHANEEIERTLEEGDDDG